jgi:Xaa-Pro aminopeptidase
MWSDRRFAKGETVALELAGSCRRYTAGLARTVQLGAKPPKVAAVENAVLEGMHAVLGATCMAIATLVRDQRSCTPETLSILNWKLSRLHRKETPV